MHLLFALAALPVDQMTVPQLGAERDALEANRPEVSAPIVLLAVGAAALAAGSACAVHFDSVRPASLVDLTAIRTAFVVTSAVVAAIGIILLGAGIPWLSVVLTQLHSRQERLDEIATRLTAIDQNAFTSSNR